MPQHARGRAPIRPDVLSADAPADLARGFSLTFFMLRLRWMPARRQQCRRLSFFDISSVFTIIAYRARRLEYDFDISTPVVSV